MKNLLFTLIALAAFAQLSFAQVSGPVDVGGNEYAFQFTGNPNIGLFFSSTSSRYEFRDAVAGQEVWIDPISQQSFFRGRVGINNLDPTARLDVRANGTTPTAIAGRGLNSPTNGYLGVQGDATDFDGIAGLSLYGGFEIGVLGLSTGGSSTDNFGVLGYSNHIGVRAENSVSGFYGEIGTSTHGARISGRVHITNGELVTLTDGGVLQTGSTSSGNILIGKSRVQARYNGAADNIIVQPFGGNLVLGQGASENAVERLRVDADSGQVATRVRVAGATKLRVGPNGGTSIGSNFLSPPENGLYVNGNVVLGTGTPALGYRVSVNGKMICEELTVQDSGSWPDYVFEADYELTPLRELSTQIDELGHLPGMPSAADVAEAGASVGEMNRLLLEKVEELTLHIIDMNEKIITLENK